ncbi:hypothetical protein CHS0354_031524 [Potamilus streckersoni]|uniref:Uncharacterized protein n=1 Tax=Potamilus streckersoni TaxID=2493646 RepID=A0AAE0SID7_9BIVA|nr:hypothetical protein CHS0354_031524 [Potamilus streckersoni]
MGYQISSHTTTSHSAPNRTPHQMEVTPKLPTQPPYKSYQDRIPTNQGKCMDTKTRIYSKEEKKKIGRKTSKNQKSFSRYGDHEKITISIWKPYQYARGRDLYPLNPSQQNRCAGTNAGSSPENTTRKTERRKLVTYSPNPIIPIVVLTIGGNKEKTTLYSSNQADIIPSPAAPTGNWSRTPREEKQKDKRNNNRKQGSRQRKQE